MSLFNFAFAGKTKPSAAQEDMVVATEREMNYENDVANCSDGALTLIKSGATRGLVSAFAMRMAAKGLPAEEITERITAFINSAAVGGDIDKKCVSWIKDSDWYQRLEWRTDTSSTTGAECMWFYASDLLEYARGTQLYSADCSRDARAKMTEQERVILDNFDKCRKAFWEAETIRDQYYTAKAKVVIHDLLVKYAETLSKLDPELFDFLCKRYEIRANADAVEEPAPPAAL